MNGKSTSKASQTDWKRIESMQEEDIDLSDIPEVTEEHLTRAKFRIAGRSVSKEKIRVHLLLDANVLAYFKMRAGGRDYQTLINEALKESILHQDLEAILRRVIREELRTTS
jgi:uncharacterized protein (DUF4415 family)